MKHKTGDVILHYTVSLDRITYKFHLWSVGGWPHEWFATAHPVSVYGN